MKILNIYGNSEKVQKFIIIMEILKIYRNYYDQTLKSQNPSKQQKNSNVQKTKTLCKFLEVMQNLKVTSTIRSYEKSSKFTKKLESYTNI
jgi:hypothetical protein